MARGTKAGVPIYLENQVVIGRATISADLKIITLEVQDDDYPLAELIKENLVGLSVVTLAADRAEDILNKKEGNNE